MEKLSSMPALASSAEILKGAAIPGIRRVLCYVEVLRDRELREDPCKEGRAGRRGKGMKREWIGDKKGRDNQT